MQPKVVRNSSVFLNIQISIYTNNERAINVS